MRFLKRKSKEIKEEQSKDVAALEKAVLTSYERFFYFKRFTQTDIESFKKYYEVTGLRPLSVLYHADNKHLKRQIVNYLHKKLFQNKPMGNDVLNLPRYIVVFYATNIPLGMYYDMTEFEEYAEYLPEIEFTGVIVKDKDDNCTLFENKSMKEIEYDLLSNGWKFVRGTTSSSLVYYKG